MKLSQLQSAIDEASKRALIETLTNQGDLTIGDLMKFAKTDGSIRSLTIAELAGKSGNGRKSTAKGARAKNASKGEVDTRTKAGRIAYQQVLLGTLEAKSGKLVSATQLRAAHGGTPDQARRALNRLIELGNIGYEGKARATRYKFIKR